MSQGNRAIPKKKYTIGTTNYIFNRVGKGGVNSSADIRSIISLLENRKKDPYYQEKLHGLKIPNPFSSNIIRELTQCISDFQASIQGSKKVDGAVDPAGSTILYLGGVRLTGKHIIVDLDHQNLYAYNGKNKIYEFHCASGDKGHPTAIKPSLHYIYRKHKEYRSRKYDAQMDYAMFFTKDGKAIHQSNAVSVTSFLKFFGADSLGSHGCVRLSEDDAKKLFSWSPMNTPVFIDMA
ncbi:L,D-transpeptidase [Microbulbifer sp. SSSA002]|uniref:L,D-transpeptidase n=1 Tax=unclassified Microbulbifer TaxID=2619833 RepID=UPI004039827D